MAVRVYQNAIETEFDEYPNGLTVTVDDEHLYVSAHGAIVIAIYSPRSWHHAKVVDQ
jgi:hypothetical protein